MADLYRHLFGGGAGVSALDTPPDVGSNNLTNENNNFLQTGTGQAYANSNFARVRTNESFATPFYAHSQQWRYVSDIGDTNNSFGLYSHWTDANNNWELGVNAKDGTWYFGTKVSGSFVSLASGSVSWSLGDLITAQMVFRQTEDLDQTVEVWLGGSLVFGPVVDTSNASAGQCALFVYTEGAPSSSNGVQIAEMQVRDDLPALPSDGIDVWLFG